VALKVLSPHLAGEAFASRFRTERQLLAQMNHPNIVRLLDGGVSATGEPYLVTEYIDGEPMDSSCDSLRLGIRQRLSLFLEVCGAVIHAHRNLVIHRDLKPGNVLVDKAGDVKLLDFGTAKLLGSREDSAATTLPLLTPRYASPEQLRNDRLNIATDVYSLGLMLYELLAGHRAFDLPNDIVRELSRATEDVPLLALGSAATPESAAARSTSLGALKAALVGDLAAIAAKAVALLEGGEGRAPCFAARAQQSYAGWGGPSNSFSFAFSMQYFSLFIPFCFFNLSPLYPICNCFGSSSRIYCCNFFIFSFYYFIHSFLNIRRRINLF